MRIVFAGTPDFAARALDALVAAGHDVVLVLAQPDRPSGRGLRVEPGAVKRLAVARAIPVAQPPGLRLGGRHAADAQAVHERLAGTPHDAMVVAAYGLILPPSVLAIPPAGCLNIHASLLPRWRGAAPVQRAIEAGDAVTGITIMQMDAGLDTGDVLLAHETPIAADETGGALTERLAVLGGVAIVEALGRLAAGTLHATPQLADGDASAATYAAKLSKADGVLDFAAPTGRLVDRIRAFDPWPGCTADLVDAADGSRRPLKVWAAHAGPAAAGSRTAPGTVLGADDAGIAVATADGSMVVTALQKPGGRRLDARDLRAEFARPGLRLAAADNARQTSPAATF